jgi:hypothetical protein
MNLKALRLTGNRVRRHRVSSADTVRNRLRYPRRQTGVRRTTLDSGSQDELVAAPRESRQPFGTLGCRQMIEQRD